MEKPQLHGGRISSPHEKTTGALTKAIDALLDTNLLIDHLRNRLEAVEHISNLARSGAPISSVVCRAEILNGMRANEKSQTRRLLDQFEWLDVTAETTDASALYYRRFHASHGLDFFDSIIAATAKIHNLSLHTANQKHYPMKDIRIVQPYG